MLDTIIKICTFVPFILYFIEIMLYRINVIEKCELEKSKYFKYLNKNLFSSINVKEILLLGLFVLFMTYENTLVLEILFPAIYLYLLIDFFHTLAKDCAKIKNKFLMVEVVILLAATFLYFIFTKHLYTTYIIMFMISILSSFIIYLLSFYKKFCK